MKTLTILILIAFSLTAFADSEIVDKIESIGEQRTGVVFIDLLEDGKAPSVDLFQEAIFGEGKSVNNFVKEVSHGKAWLKGKTYPWLKLKSTGKTCYLSSEEVLETIAEHELFDITEIDRVLVVYNLEYTKECFHNRSFGFSTLGKEDFSTSKGPVRLSIAQFFSTNRFVLPQLPSQPLSGISSSVISHEFGHSLGIRGHSNILDCGKLSVDFDRANCTQSAIADMFSLMGGEGFFRATLHYSACHKADLGWLNEADKSLIVLNKKETPQFLTVRLRPYETIGENVSVKINLQSPLPIPCANPENCKVNIGALFLEYRTPRGFDENLVKLNSQSEDVYDQIVFSPDFYKNSKKIDTKGIQIRGGFYIDDHCMTSYNLDLTPESIQARNQTTGEIVAYSLYDNLDSFLTVGKTFNEPVNGLQVSVKEIDKDGFAVVEIQY